MKYILLTLTAFFLFSGCSTKQINGNVESITGDISNAFDGSTDKSATSK